MAISITITADATQLAAVLARLEQGVQATGAKVDRVFEQMSEHTQRSTQRMVQSFERMHQSIAQSFNLMSATVNRFLGLLASIGVGVSLSGLIKGAVDTAAGFEQLDTQLRFVVGSMEAFQQARQFIIQFTATTPFQLEEVSKAFINLTRRGFDVQRTLKGVADAASLQRFPSEALDRIVFAMGQIADRGKLSQQELNQLSEAGISTSRVLEELALMGVKVGEDIGASAISAKVGIEAITQVLEKDFRNAMLATAGNWTTLVSNLLDTWNVFQDTIVRGPILDFLKGMVAILIDDMVNAINNDKAAFQAFGVVAVSVLQDIARNLAAIIDLLGLALRAGETFQGVIAQVEREGGQAIANAAKSVTEFLGLTETMERLGIQAKKDVTQAGTAIAEAFAANSPAQDALNAFFERSAARGKELAAQADKILAENEKRVAQQRRQLSTTAGGGDADRAAKAAAKAEEQAIQQSLRRQEALIAQSFDERRAIADAFFAEEIRKAPGEAEQINKVRIEHMRTLAQEEATMVEAVRLASNNRLLASASEHAMRQEEILAKTMEVRRRLSKEATDDEIRDIIRANDTLEKAREQGLEDFAKQTRSMQAEQERELQQSLARQERAYESFVNRVAGMLESIFTGLLEGTLSAVDFFKRLLIQSLSGIASSVLAPLIASLAAGAGNLLSQALPSIGGLVLQGIGVPGGIPGTATGEGFSTLQGVGLLASMRTVAGAFTNGLAGLTKVLLNAGSTISTTFGGPTLGILPEGVSMQGVLNVGPGSAGGAVLGGLGGAAAIAGGIYGALNATNAASKAAYAASAAAGTAALASTALVAAGVVAATSGWTGIGLIASAVLAIVGTVTEMLISPAGPALAVGRPSGLGIGVQDGRLAVSGDLGSQVLRREGVDPGMVRGVQAQMEEGLTNAVMRIVDTINAVALDPAALLGPTQEALQRALATIRPINTANAQKMEQDITEQLRFVNVQIVGGMLGPLNEAFNQLRDQGDLQEQLDRLPATTAGLVQVFRTMNDQLAEMGASKNTDVLRQLSGVRNQVENFGNRVAGTAAQIAESIVNQLVTSMQQTVVPTLAGQITQFAGLMDASFRALTELRATQQTLEGAGLQGGGVGAQIDRLTTTMSVQAERISTEIVSGALEDLARELDVILIQPIRVQATTVNGLFTDSLAALNALWAEWHRLEAEGIDASRVHEQFDRMLGGMLDSVQRITEQAFSGGNFTEFLNVLLSIPEALANMNPITQQIRQMGLVFAQVAGPIEEVIRAVSLELQTPAQRAADASQRMFELRDAIAQTGNAIDQALPLYGQLAQAIQANATAQIEAVNEQAQAQIDFANEWSDAQRDLLRTWVEDNTKAWNDWADAQMEALNTWVETTTTMVNDWAGSAQTTASQLATVNDILMGEMSPAQQRGTLEAQKAQLEAVVNATGSPQALTELISVNQQLLELAKQSDDLALVMASQQELQAIQTFLQEQLAATTGYTDPVLAQIHIAQTQEDWLEYIALHQDAQAKYIQDTQQAQLQAIADYEEAHLQYIQETQDARLKQITDWQQSTVRAIKEDLVYQLQLVQYELQKMFAMQYQVLTGIALPQPVHPSQMLIYDPTTGSVRPPVLFQRGGIAGLASGLHYAQGGMVPAMLEPGEGVLTGPFTPAQQGALMAWNQAFPRFASGGWTVPGRGSGDTVPAWLPSGAFVMNRQGWQAMGHQGGGPVTGHPSAMPTVVIDLRGSQFSSAADASKIRNILEREVVRIWESYQRKTRVDTRLT